MKRFLPAIFFAALVVVTAPFVGLIRDALFDNFPKLAVRALAAILAALAGAFFLYALVRIRDRRLLRYGGLGVVGLLLWLQAVGFSSVLAQVVVVEKVHIIEYGLLAFLLYRAFRPAGDLSVLLLPILWVAFAGAVEEGVQWWVETRTGEVRDVLLNILSGVCGLVFGLSLEPLEGFSWRTPARRWRRLGDTTAFVTLSLGLFVYAVHLGYEIEDPEIGRFRSWFTREELQQAAAERAERWAREPPRELSPWHREDLFLTEAGWHNMHRNHSYELGLYAWARQANRILEKYYKPYLDLESFRKTGNRRFPPHVLQQLDAEAARIDPASYLSPVLADRIFVASKPLFLAVLLPVVLLIWALPRLLTRP